MTVTIPNLAKYPPEYTAGLVALYNLSVALDKARSIPVGAPPFPHDEDPMVYIQQELSRVANKLCPMVSEAWETMARTDANESSKKGEGEGEEAG